MHPNICRNHLINAIRQSPARTLVFGHRDSEIAPTNFVVITFINSHVMLLTFNVTNIFGSYLFIHVDQIVIVIDLKLRNPRSARRLSPNLIILNRQKPRTRWPNQTQNRRMFYLC